MRLKLLSAALVVIGLSLPVDVVKAGLRLDFKLSYNDACADEGLCTSLINNYCGGKIHKKKIST